ncbi:hypothetical protein PFMALIP_05062 [Plasmodium falciparum MaliPS096_E11]|uniref:Uncharacterized protein n=1 Tax=Plasmodium falciparum MaliPS096_E11 TaxID=1036727 RepID=A0A024WI73_PLAFA|nr:hypothetical protein PFMALIP_05062 [Plasmodium falciparum MaliPS096_E11]
MARGEHNESINEKEIQNFFEEIDNLVNEKEKEDDNYMDVEKQLHEKCLKLINKKKETCNLCIKSKIKLFLDEINFINNSLDIFENEKRQKQIKQENKKIQKNGTKELDEILKDVIFLELGLKESKSKNETNHLLLKISENLHKIEDKEFLLTTKKSLDIRIGRTHISSICRKDKYTNDKLSSQHNEKENQLKENLRDSTKRKVENLIVENNVLSSRIISKDTDEGKKHIIGIKHENDNVKDEKSEEIKPMEKKTSKKNKKEIRIDSSNYFHKKKLKLVERWNRVAQESKLLSDYDSNS